MDSRNKQLTFYWALFTKPDETVAVSICQKTINNNRFKEDYINKLYILNKLYEMKKKLSYCFFTF